MSFKRSGEDENLLKNLNHQRVRELLGSHIPQDEAKLLSNGRLSCMICVHRPVFDTINMLGIHRRGKKHLLELSRYIKCKEDAVLREVQRKRPHPEDAADKACVKMTEPNLVNTLHHSPILGSKCASSKQSALRHRRKPILEIQPTVSAEVPVLKNPDTTETKSASATVRHYLKSLSRKSSLERVVERNRENYGIDLQRDNSRKDTIDSAPVSEDLRIPVETSSEQPRDQTAPHSNSELLDQEIKLRMSGWIKDSTGKWMKDPNVEFDSDEDENPLSHT